MTVGAGSTYRKGRFPGWTATIPRWTTFVPAYGMAAAALPLPIYRMISSFAGVSVGFTYALVQVPVLLAGIRLLPLLASSRLMRVLVLTVGLSGLSLVWSATDVVPYGLQLFLGLLLVLAWSVVVAADPETLGRLARVGFVVVAVALPITVANLISPSSAEVPFAIQYPYLGHPVGAFGEWIPAFNVVVVALFARMVWDSSSESDGASWTTLYYLVCLGLLMASAKRAVTLGAAMGLAYWGVKRRGVARYVGLALGALLVLGVLLVLVGPSAGKEVSGSTDILSRYQAMGEDRLSGRLDNWGRTLEQLRHDPMTILVGTGLAAADRYVTDANGAVLTGPASYTKLSADSTPLEMVVALGIAGLALGAVMLVLISKRLIELGDPGRWALWMTIGVVALTSVPAFGYASGGVILVGMGFGVLLPRRTSSAVR